MAQFPVQIRTRLLERDLREKGKDSDSLIDKEKREREREMVKGRT